MTFTATPIAPADSSPAGRGVMEFDAEPGSQVASVWAATSAALPLTVPHCSRPFRSTRPFGKGNQVAPVGLVGGVIPQTPRIERAIVGDGPTAIAVGTPTGGRGELVLVANRDSNSLSILDPTTLALLQKVSVGRQPAALAFVPNSPDLLVLDTLDDELLDVKLNTLAIRARVSPRSPLGLGASPSALAVSSEGSTTYVALSQDKCANGNLRVAGGIPTAGYPSCLSLPAKAPA